MYPSAFAMDVIAPDCLKTGTTSPFSIRTGRYWWRPVVDVYRRDMGSSSPADRTASGSRPSLRRTGIRRPYPLVRHEVG